MKRNIIVSVFSGFFGSALLLILLSAAGIVGARSADVPRDQTRPESASAATPLTSTFTYQGQLKNGGSAVTGSCSMAFRLYDDPSTGNLIGGPITPTVPVTNGLFTVGLNFGSNAFDGNGRWLDIQVDCGGDFTALTPRQPLTTVPYASFANNTNQLNGQDSSAFMNTSGDQTIGGIKTFLDGVKFTDGTTQTTAFYRPALPGPGAVANVDSWGDVGSFSSITIGADGLGLISYQDVLFGHMKVLHCADAACTSGIPTTVNLTGDVGYYSSITIGADGLGLISYLDNTDHALKTLHCGNLTCNSLSGINTIVDSSGDVGYYTSITIGTDGLGLISYWDAVNGDLKVLHCDNVACTSGTPITVDNNAGNVGLYTSITIGADGLGLISYYDFTHSDLKYYTAATWLAALAISAPPWTAEASTRPSPSVQMGWV
jgi:hypothetical protein